MSLEGVTKGMKITNKGNFHCKICVQGKMCHYRSRDPDEKSKKPLELVHSDLAGPISPTSFENSMHVMSFVDDFSGLIFVYFLKSKSDSDEAFKKFLTDSAPFGSVKRLRTDNGTEYSSRLFKAVVMDNKIKHEFTAPYSPHQSGTAERSWRSLFEMARMRLESARGREPLSQRVPWFRSHSCACRCHVDIGVCTVTKTVFTEIKLKILSKFRMSDCNPKSIPCDPSANKLDVSSDSKNLCDPKLFREIVGSLIYLMTCTRADICYVVTLLSQHLTRPTNAHLNLCKFVLKYLKGTILFGLKFVKSENPMQITGFSDSDWGGFSERKSISGYVFKSSSSSSLITWKSKKQNIVALSSCEAEYITLTYAVQEGIFLKQLLCDMDGYDEPVEIFVDNRGAIDLAKNPVHHQRSKHIDIRYHFIRAIIQDNKAVLSFVPSEENMADMFTKPVSRQSLLKFHTLPKPLTSSVIKKLETKAAPRLTANEKLHNRHSGVHKALPERSTKLTMEDPNGQLNSVRGILNTPAHTGPTASATPASNKRGETTNNEEDCQSTAEVLRSTVTWPVQDSKAKHHLAYTNELVIIGDAMEEEERVIILLSSLPDRFSTLVTALEAHEKIPAWEVVTERLLNEERRQRGSLGTSDSTEELLILLSRDVVFNESQFMSFEKEPSKEIECVPWSFPLEEKHKDSEGELELRRSTRNRAAPDRFGGWV
ncbi:Integrase catalytic core [Trinorchestia longiramus]|nr:Integrase catalytic core [Trinorchestia longiramus]